MAGSTRVASCDVIASASPGDSLATEARDRLRHSGYSALGAVICEAEGSTLRLRGRVRSYYLKQLSQETVAGIPGVGRIVNLITVAEAPRGRSPSRTVHHEMR